MNTRKATPNYLKITTHDTTLEALLTGAARLASYRDWPATEVLNLADPFQNAVPCFQQIPCPRCTDDHLCGFCRVSLLRD